MIIEIAICDNDCFFVKKMVAILHDYFRRKRIKFSITLFDDPQRFLSSDLRKYDIFFIDTNMPKINGIEIGQDIRNYRGSSIIVYISNLDEYALDAYSVHAFHYLLKENIDIALVRCMDDIIHYLPLFDVYILPTEDGAIKIKLSDIQYFEIQDHSIIVHTVNTNLNAWRFCGKLSLLEAQLSNIGFVRIHKSYLVNIQHLSRIQKESVVLDSGTELPCSRQRKKDILNRYHLLTDDIKSCCNQ